MLSPFSTIAITAGLILLIPLAIAAERADFNTWQSRLALPEFKDTLNRHTPLHATGTVLPPTILENRTFTAADNPIILVRETVVPPGVTVTLSDGAQIFAHEFATLRVDGTLEVRGTVERPITFTTNELHPQNKVWNGLLAGPSARLNIDHAEIHYAAPALTCLPGSVVTQNRLETKNTNQATFGC